MQGMDSVLRFTLCCLCPFSGAFCEVLNLVENLVSSDIQKLPRLEFEGFLLSLSHFLLLVILDMENLGTDEFTLCSVE